MSMGRDIARMLDPVLMAQDCGITPDKWQADLLRSTERRALLLCSRQSGKTTTTSLIALHNAIYTSDALVVIVSPSERQSKEMLRTIRLLHGSLDGAPKIANGSGSVLKLEFANGSRILALPGTEKTIRGLAGASLVVVDEAARVDDELFAAVRPMLITNKRSRLILLTTPKGRRGYFFNSWHDIGEGDRWHRVRITAADCPRITKEELDDELRNLGPTQFAEEYGLEFIDNNETAFSTAIIEAAFTDEFKALWI